jgi:Glycosyl hydrolase family 67 N-terminus
MRAHSTPQPNLDAHFSRKHLQLKSWLGRLLGYFLLATCLITSGSMLNAADPALNLNAAVVVVPPGLTGPERKAVTLLVEEAEKRGLVRWDVRETTPPSGQPAIYLGQRAALTRAFPAIAAHLPLTMNLPPEGFTLSTALAGSIVIAGNDARGVLYGAGRLLRALSYGRESITLETPLNLTTAPKYRIRGHQFAYRPKTNSYDGWTVAMWEQYLRDLLVYGINAIEIIPPRSDDDADSPHFNLTPIRMMIELSRLARDYGIELWIWYPALDKDYGQPAQVEFALKEWRSVLSQLPKVDALFIPGGDPGHTPPKDLFPMMEKQAAQLRALHPQARVWMSPQGFNAAWMDDFYAIMKSRPAWLEGVAFGPQQRVSVEELKAHLPAGLPIRFYPDITHTLSAQFPVPNWDYPFQVTLNREPINPRPLDQAAIFRRLQPLNEFGVITYSEGCNDDVNKVIWSTLSWAPETAVVDILRDYSRYFIGANLAEAFAQGLLALERNWRGPLATNAGVGVTLAQFQAMEKAATPAQLRQWRFQQGLYRAYYDATIRARLLAETVQEQAALEDLRGAGRVGARAALAAAEQRIALPETPPAAQLRARTFELAEALFQSIHMQLSVPRYQAINVGRGANLDLIDTPLSNAPWLRDRFTFIRTIASETDRLKAIDDVLNWENPGAGGFYDDLGNATTQPHLVLGSAYADDPAFLKAPHQASDRGRSSTPLRISSRTYSESRDDQPLELLYRDLDPRATYRLRVVYGTGAMGSRDLPMLVKLVANGRFEVHPLRPKDPTGQPVEFALPVEATRSGELRLTWSRPAGLGGNGRGVEVAEVWLIRTAPAAHP